MPPRTREKYEAEALWNYALRLLGGRAQTIGELNRKLTARAADPGDVAGVLSRLKEMRILNDRQFADTYTAVRRDGPGLGKSRVLRELAHRQVPRLVAEAAVQQAYQDVDEVDHALHFLQRKLRIADPAEYFKDPKHVQSAYRKLRYNGFSSPAAVKALRRWSTEVEHLEDEPED